MDKQPEGMTQYNNHRSRAEVIIVSFLKVAYTLKYPVMHVLVIVLS